MGDSIKPLLGKGHIQVGDAVLRSKGSDQKKEGHSEEVETEGAHRLRSGMEMKGFRSMACFQKSSALAASPDK